MQTVVAQVLVLDHALARVVVFSSLTEDPRVLRRMGDAIAGPGAIQGLNRPQVLCVVVKRVACFFGWLVFSLSLLICFMA